MPKTAILSDIHANLPALKAVLHEVASSGAQQVVFLGDIVGYGASPSECINLVRKLGGNCVLGNHEIEVLSIRKIGKKHLDPDWKESGYLAGLVHSAESITAEQDEWLMGLKYAKRIPGAVVAHACLDDPMAFSYINDYETAIPTLEILKSENYGTGFFGHTHIQEVFHHPGTKLDWKDESTFTIPECEPCVIMVGSVGQPRSEDDRRASWILWDPETRTVELRKTEYNRIASANDIIREGLPLETAARLLNNEELKALTQPT